MPFAAAGFREGNMSGFERLFTRFFMIADLIRPDHRFGRVFACCADRSCHRVHFRFPNANP